LKGRLVILSVGNQLFQKRERSYFVFIFLFFKKILNFLNPFFEKKKNELFTWIKEKKNQTSDECRLF